MARSHPILAIATAAYLVLIVTLTFIGGDEPPSPLWSLLAFIGVGALLCALSAPRRWWVALGFGVLGAAWIEVAQAIWRPPGFASVVDLLLGVLGTVIGVAGVVAIRAAIARIPAAPPVVHAPAPADDAPVQPRS